MTSGYGIKGKLAAAFLNALQIKILNIIYGKVALKLNDWENHEKDNTHSDSLALKLFLFKIVNTYSGLLYMAFLKESLETHTKTICKNNAGEVVSCSLAGVTKHTVTVPGCTSCLYDLGFQLLVVFATSMSFNVLELGMPYLKWKIKNYSESKKVEKSDDPTMRKNLYPVEENSKLEPYESPLDDYMEMAIQFGFVALFGASMPLIPLLALIEITLEIRVDAWKICNLTRRPDPNRSENIGIWKQVIVTIAYLGAFSNAGLVVFTSGLFSEYDYFHRLLFFAALEHFLLLGMYIIGAFIVDMPTIVRNGIDWGRRIVFKKNLGVDENTKEVSAEYSTFHGGDFELRKEDMSYHQ